MLGRVNDQLSVILSFHFRRCNELAVFSGILMYRNSLQMLKIPMGLINEVQACKSFIKIHHIQFTARIYVRGCTYRFLLSMLYEGLNLLFYILFLYCYNHEGSLINKNIIFNDTFSYSKTKVNHFKIVLWKCFIETSTHLCCHSQHLHLINDHINYVFFICQIKYDIWRKHINQDKQYKIIFWFDPYDLYCLHR